MTDVTALRSLLVCTTDLELRLGSHDDLRELGRLAEQGIHPLDEMPFAVAWTDNIGKPSFLDDFVAFHEQALADWSPADWTLNLLVWHAGRLVGTQSVGAEHFAEMRRVATGSWLGRTYQRRGIGTRMRAAVLELAFRGLAADAADSSWLEGNEASRRVSEKLGYLEVARSSQSPRGEPVVSHDVSISREEWRCPIPVAIEGLEACLSLFLEQR